MKQKKQTHKKIWNQYKKDIKDPKFRKAIRDFIKITTS